MVKTQSIVLLKWFILFKLQSILKIRNDLQISYINYDELINNITNRFNKYSIILFLINIQIF